MSESFTPENPAFHKAVGPVIEFTMSAKRWMSDGIKRWAEDDHEGMILLGPMALEQLAKAALWAKGPALLAQLDKNSDYSLIKLASGTADLKDPKLRTIGLLDSLTRVQTVFNEKFKLPNEKSLATIVNLRNGAVHASASKDASDVLDDILTITNTLLRWLNYIPAVFYGDQYATVQRLVLDKRDKRKQRLTAKMSRALNQLTELEARLGEQYYSVMKERREQAMLSVDLDHYSPFHSTLTHDCPACHTETGRLIGTVRAEPEWDYEDGHSFVVGSALYFTPLAFWCNVCKLRTEGDLELEFAGIETDDIEVEDGELDVRTDVEGIVMGSYEPDNEPDSEEMERIWREQFAPMIEEKDPIPPTDIETETEEGTSSL